MGRWRRIRQIPRLIFLGLVLGFCLACVAVMLFGRPADRVGVPLSSDVYIWQRQWTSAVVQAAGLAGPAIRNWHVLAAEQDQKAQWHDARMQDAAKALAGHEVIAVFRLSGRLQMRDSASIVAHIRQVLAAWHDAGITPHMIEIDHDSPTARLHAYRLLLADIRNGLGGTCRLAITALPTWIGAPELPLLLAGVDQVNLQLHAVLNPAGGLFNTGQALRAARAFGAITSVPWRIALPAYGTRIVQADNGESIIVESEIAQGIAPELGQELTVSPIEVARFMKIIEANPPARFQGWIWFRLPVAGDRRAWSLPSWLTLVRHDVPRIALSATARRAAGALAGKGSYDIVIHNAGTVDAMLPLILRGDGACIGIGAQTPYRLDYDRQGAVLVRTGQALLPVGQEVVAGWLNCQRERTSIRASAVELPSVSISP